MIILAIETSCDDTCVAIVEAKGRKKPCFSILSNIISSQVEIHKKWGGVYPTLAKREHQKNLPLVLKKALNKAKNPKVDLIAVTIGPGLEPCLWVGVNFAKDLAKKLDLPIIPVNHIEAHIFANWLDSNRNLVGKTSRQGGTIEFPAICLVVSGGHTQLILMKEIGNYEIIGETRDDAAGECFDKVARILGLDYPGGPAIAAEATKLQVTSYKPPHLYIGSGGKLQAKLPRPMIHQKNYDFSFSGLKTAVLYNFRSQPLRVRKSKKYIQYMCAESQRAIIDVLIYKTIKAAKNCKAKTIILGGGVTANKELRKQLRGVIKKQLPNTYYLIPNTSLCTDNAVMIGVAGYFQWIKGEKKNYKDIEANANLRV